MKPFLLMFLFSLAGFLFFCTNEKASDKDKDVARGAFLLSQLSRTSSTSSSGGKFPIPTCETASPAFSTLAAAGFNSTCGTSGCHNGSVRYNTTDYTTVKGTYTNPGSPTTSILYREQSTGTMAIYTNQALDKAIYCWIAGGSSP